MSTRSLFNRSTSAIRSLHSSSEGSAWCFNNLKEKALRIITGVNTLRASSSEFDKVVHSSLRFYNHDKMLKADPVILSCTGALQDLPGLRQGCTLVSISSSYRCNLRLDFLKSFDISCSFVSLKASGDALGSACMQRGRGMSRQAIYLTTCGSWFQVSDMHNVARDVVLEMSWRSDAKR